MTVELKKGPDIINIYNVHSITQIDGAILLSAERTPNEEDAVPLRVYFNTYHFFSLFELKVSPEDITSFKLFGPPIE